jgi:lactate dehydrogenase-like 2-hydroxyacid dehydrogenase
VRALGRKAVPDASASLRAKRSIAPAFLTLPNVIVQPHQGSATVETRSAIGQLMLDNLVAWFERRPPLTPVA